MAQALISNNAATTLSTAITTTGQLSMVVVDSSKFPTPTGGDYFYCTLLDASNIPEIVKVTAVAGSTFTIVRAQESTAARTFTSGASVRLALTAAVMGEFSRTTYVDSGLALKAAKAGDTYTGTHNFSGATAVTLPANTNIGSATPTAISYIINLTSDAQAQINSLNTLKAPIASPTFTGTVTIPSGASIAGFAPLASPVFTGNPTAPTPSAGDNDTSVATTAFVQGEIAAKAPIASPAFTGTPTAPTATLGDSSTTLATTAFVAATAFSAVLPAQSGNGGKLLTTDGSVASWASPPSPDLANMALGIV